MATVRLTAAELSQDLEAVLAKVQAGIEVIVEQDQIPIAVISRPHRSGRPVSEILRQAKERNSKVTLDADFSRDLEAVISDRQHPWTPPSWE